MSDEIVLGGKTYVSSKKASETTGYARDYIGQMAREGLVEAQRVGGLWYVSPESLEAYRANSELQKPIPPPLTGGSAYYDADSAVSFDGKEYISASRAAKITGYNPDYIGQLARKGTVLSRQIGNRWYVERSALVAHKTEKDRLLGAVQAEAAGLGHRQESLLRTVAGTNPHIAPAPTNQSSQSGAGTHFQYSADIKDLFPQIQEKEQAQATEGKPAPAEPQVIPIRRIKDVYPDVRVPAKRPQTPRERPLRTSRKTMFTATKVVAALVVVFMLAYSAIAFQGTTVYSSAPLNQAQEVGTRMMAGSVVASQAIGELLAKMMGSEVQYSR